MGNSKKKYEKKRDQILQNKKLSETKKNSLLFNNWQGYIFSSLTESTQKENTQKFDNEMIFVRIHNR